MTYQFPSHYFQGIKSGYSESQGRWLCCYWHMKESESEIVYSMNVQGIRWYDHTPPCKIMTRVQLQNNDEGRWDQMRILIVSPRNLTGISTELLQLCLSNFRAIGKKLKPEFRSPGTPQNSTGGQTPAQQKEGPAVLHVEMSAKVNLPLAQTPLPTWNDTRTTMLPVQFYTISSFASIS